MSSESLKKRTGFPVMTMERFLYELGNHELLAPGCEELASGGWELEQLNEIFASFFTKFKIQCTIHFELESGGGSEKQLSGKWRLEGADSEMSFPRARAKEMFNDIVAELNGCVETEFSDFAEHYLFTSSANKKQATPKTTTDATHSEERSKLADTNSNSLGGPEENAKKEQPNVKGTTPTPKPAADSNV